LLSCIWVLLSIFVSYIWFIFQVRLHILKTQFVTPKTWQLSLASSTLENAFRVFEKTGRVHSKRRRARSRLPASRENCVLRRTQ
jgi:hypothetical protein